MESDAYLIYEVEINFGKQRFDALLANIPNEQVTGEEKLERWQTARLIYKGSEVDITAETIALLKRRIGLMYSVRVTGQGGTK